MQIDDFRRRAHTLVDWMADYLESVGDYPVRAQTAPGAVAARLPATAPEEGEPFERIFADFRDIVMPGMTHWQHPRFFAYFPGNSSPPSVLAEMLTATLGAQCMLWQTSPAATEMETRMMAWLGRMIGLPADFSGVIQDSASSATLCALLAARERATGWRVNEAGVGAAPRLTVYASAEAHSSIEKDVMIAGLGRANLRKIAADAEQAMIPEALDAAVAGDKAAGAAPCCVVATLGTTGAGGVDPLAAIADVCARHGVYLHVDAAWAGSALICAEWRGMIAGVERADSFVFNPHKWMFTNFDCSAHFVRDTDTLVRTLTVLPEYLKGRETGQVIDYRDWSVPLGRRFRALKLWFVIRSYGVERLRSMIRAHVGLAAELAGRIDAAPDFDLTSPARLALLTFRYHPSGVDDPDDLDRLNARLLDALNDGGRVYLTRNRLNGRFVLRVSIGQTSTTRRDVEIAWQVIRETAREL